MTRYRIVEDGPRVFVEASYRFLWFTCWSRVRDYYAGSPAPGYSHGDGPYTNFGTVARAQEYILNSMRLDARYVWPVRITEYVGKPFNPGHPPVSLYR